MERLIFATGNEGKMREIRDILADISGDSFHERGRHPAGHKGERKVL